MMIKRTFAPALMALILGVSAFSTPAFAYTGETEATEERVITIQTSTEESKAEAQTETQKETEIKKTEEKEAEQFQLDEETMKEIQKMLLAYLAGNDKITVSIGDGETNGVLESVHRIVKNANRGRFVMRKQTACLFQTQRRR